MCVYTYVHRHIQQQFSETAWKCKISINYLIWFFVQFILYTESPEFLTWVFRNCSVFSSLTFLSCLSVSYLLLLSALRLPPCHTWNHCGLYIAKPALRNINELHMGKWKIFTEFWSGLQELSLYVKWQFSKTAVLRRLSLLPFLFYHSLVFVFFFWLVWLLGWFVFVVCFACLFVLFFLSSAFPGFSPVPNNASSTSYASFLYLCFWIIMP